MTSFYLGYIRDQVPNDVVWGANDLTGSRWTCLVVQMSTPKIWQISNAESTKSGHNFYFNLTSSYLGYIGDQLPNVALGGQMI